MLADVPLQERLLANLWGAESPSDLSGGPTGPATISRRPCSSALLTRAFRLLIDLALTLSRRQGRTTGTGGTRLHPFTWLSRHRRTWPFVRTRARISARPVARGHVKVPTCGQRKSPLICRVQTSLASSSEAT